MRTARTAQPRVILATLLVALSLFAGIAPCQRSVVPIDQPRFLQVEGIEFVIPYLGAVYYYRPQSGNMAIRVLKATWHSGKGFRAGISGLDANGPMDIDQMGDPWGLSIAPVHIGYDIVFGHKRTGFFYGVVPSCYVEATLGAFPPYAKIALACDVDYYGVGTGIEVGCVDWNHKPDYARQVTRRSFIPAVYASLKLRLLDVAFRLPGHHN